MTREPERIADIEAGLVTVDGAATQSGVIVSDGAVDAVATEKRRADMIARRRANIPLFNFGGDIETLQEQLPKPKSAWRAAGRNMMKAA